MTYRNSSALLAAIVLMAGSALAQETAPTTQPEATAGATQDAADSASPATEAATTEAPAEEAPAEAATTEAPAEEAPAAAEPTEPQVGDYFVKTTHSDWTIRCVKAEEGQPDPCEMYQLLKDGEGHSVAEVTMIPLSQGEAAAGATIVAPLETDLVRGMGLKVDSAAARGYPFNFCAREGCVSRIGFDAEGLAGLKRGKAATVSLLPFGADPESPVELPMSLAGFTSAFTEIEGIFDAAQKQLDAQAKAAPAADAAAEGEPAAEAAPADAAEGEAAPAN